MAVAAAALGAAYLYFSAEAEKANTKMEDSAKRAAEAQVAFEKLANVRRSATDAELVGTGKATAADLALRWQRDRNLRARNALVVENAHDVSAHVAQQHGGKRAGADAAKFKNPDARKRAVRSHIWERPQTDRN